MRSTRSDIDTQTTAETKRLTFSQQFNVDFVSGLTAGVTCAGLFNPWDRALYLSVTKQRPFLLWENFKSPYHGFWQTVTQRTFQGGIYYFFQGEMSNYLYPSLRSQFGFSDPVAQFCVGLAAGSISGVLTNSIAAVKYHTWGHEQRSFISSVKEMWVQGGASSFFKGTHATVIRDTVFGSTYEVLRTLMRAQYRAKHTDDAGSKFQGMEIIFNGTAAGLATMLSSPFNFARNMQYATPPDTKPPTIYQSLQNVWMESRLAADKPWDRLLFFQRRFRIGWGAARTAVGMAVGQKLFDMTRSTLSNVYAQDAGHKPGMK